MTSLAIDGLHRADSDGRRAEFRLRTGECWWGGAVEDGTRMPFRAGERYECDLRRDIRGNQAVPLLLSSHGRYIWSDDAFAFSIEPSTGVLTIQAPLDTLVVGDGHGTLAGAYRAAAERHFPTDRSMPDPLCFSAPQFNSWIEMQYEPTQVKVLAYAHQIVGQGLPPGVLIIDDNWFEDHGDWRFHSGRFPDPRGMIAALHALGFRVLLWISPFISPDGQVYRELARRGLLVRRPTEDGEPVVRRWWNGQSALLDVTHPGAIAWLTGCLDRLMRECGADGYKFDAGDPEYCLPGDVFHDPIDGVGYCEAWARIGLAYRFNEYRACWKLAGQPLVQRLRDKFHDWGPGGLADIIPNGLAQGLAGYAFTCPDMVGGGDIGSFLRPDFHLDQELFVRTVQCSALFPILQFSIAPWRVLDREHWGYCQEAIRLRQELVPEILRLARHAAETGEPMLRHLEYAFPGYGFERVRDQFLLGTEILVAPVTVRGANRRTVVFPPGTWIDTDGNAVTGPCTQEVSAPLSRLPFYRRR